MVTTNRLFQDFISFVTDADPGGAGVTLSAPGLTDLIVVGSPNFVALTLDPQEVFGAPEVVWVSVHTSSATTATIVRAQEGSAARAHAIGTQVILGVTQDSIGELEADIATNVTDIATNVTDIATNVTDITALQDIHGALRASRESISQGLTSGVAAQIIWNTIELEQDPADDVDLNTSTGVITINTNGWHLINAHWQVSDADSGTTKRQLRLTRSGGGIGNSAEQVVGGHTDGSVEVTLLCQASATQTIVCIAETTGGTGEGVQEGAGSHIAIIRLA